jgi:putative tryptophan/tyrosine transport system substrate-binding protein
VRRREVMVGLVAAAWPHSAGAQAPNPNRRLGILTTTGENDPEWKAERTAFLETLKGFGWTEGQNLHVDYRFAAGDANRAAAFAKELVNLKPDA